MKRKTKFAHCPIFKRRIGLPVWLDKKHPGKYAGWCDCKSGGRAFTAREVIWK